jgi:alpha 1,3-glucosidase
MKMDPYTLTVALSKFGSAKGDLYIDDGTTYGFEKGDFIWRGFEANTDHQGGSVVLTSRDLKVEDGNNTVQNIFVEEIASVRIERVVILGLSKEPKEVNIGGARHAEWTWAAGEPASGDQDDAIASTLTIENPGLFVTKDWAVLVA